MVESPVHQQDKLGGAGTRQGRVKGLTDINGNEKNDELGKHLPDESIVSEERDELGEDRVSSESGGVSNGHR